MAAAVQTEFASAERSSVAELERQRSYFGGQRLPKEILEFIPNPIMVLNQHRQIVYANPAAQKLANGNGAALAGLRPGEALGCRHAQQAPGRCGTTKFCRYCGNTRAILESQSGRDAIEECRITVQHGETEEALDLRVWAHPTEWNHERFTVLALTDIADEKRRAFLERIFLHDIMNTAMALHGFCQLLETGTSATASREHFIERMAYLSHRIMDEILAQRQLRDAESGSLRVSFSRLRSDAFLRTLLDCYNRTDFLKGRKLEIAEVSHDTEFLTDPALLGRVLGNMIKNAIEATGSSGTVRIGCLVRDGWVSFWVHNPEHVPEAIQLQIFKRSFSTKEPGRGLGTYSMKYLSEKYLGGSISFTSTEQDGTTVTASYPVSGPDSAQQIN